MVFNATFNDISVISWGSVLLMEESRENHRLAVSHWQTLSHNVVLSTPRLSTIPTHNFTPLLSSTFFVYTLCIYRNLYCLWTEISYTYQFRIFLAIGHIYFFIQTWRVLESINFGIRGCSASCADVLTKTKHFIDLLPKTIIQTKS